MSMPLPPNTLPMMTGTGPFGPIEMGGMFTVMKVREDLAPGNYKDPGWYKHPNYKDPGWYKHPKGTVAYEVDAGQAGAPPSQPGAGKSPGMDMPMEPGGGHQHHH